MSDTQIYVMRRYTEEICTRVNGPLSEKWGFKAKDTPHSKAHRKEYTAQIRTELLQIC